LEQIKLYRQNPQITSRLIISEKIFYKRNLPHYQPIGFTFFITFRLAGSLPAETIFRLKKEKEKELKVVASYIDKKIRYEEYKFWQSRYFGKFDHLLDLTTTGPRWLGEKKIAEVVKELIHSFDKIYYELICYCIMPNHVHIIFTPLNVDRSVASIKNKNEEQNSVSIDSKKINLKQSADEAGASFYIVTKILQDLKSKTALEANKILNRFGAFWQHESYDHAIRNFDELKQTTEYILNNPVKAGLCERWEDWEWNYCNFDLIR